MYTVKYFIDKFEAIPTEEIGISVLDNHCALWHCGVRHTQIGYKLTEEAIELSEIFEKTLRTSFEDQGITLIYTINDSRRTWGSTPKDRILNILYKAQEMGIE